MRRTLSSMILGLAVAVRAGGAASAAAEEPPDPRLSAAVAGDRVRLRKTGERHLLTGKVLEIDQETLVLARGREGGVLRVPVASLDRLEVARGRRGHAGLGAAIGFVPGALFMGTVVGVLACDDQGGHCSSVVPALVGGLLGGAATGAVGALVGLAVRTDRWQPVPLAGPAAGRKPTVGIDLAPTSGRGFRVGVSVGF